MVVDYVSIALSFFHLVGAFIWVGAALYMGFIFSPVLNKLEPSVRGPLMRNLLPKQTKILTIAIVMTGLTGLLRSFRIVPNYSVFTTTVWGWGIVLGGIAAVIMALIGFMVIIPSGNKMLKLTAAGPPPGAGGASPKNPPGPPPEIAKLQKRLQNGGIINFFLSFVVIFGMAVAG